MNARARAFVWHRAQRRCEYCRLSADVLEDRMHVEHIIAKQHRGGDGLDNLALACSHCNRHKGPNLATFDPDGSTLIRLFHPRRDVWEEHFQRQHGRILGRTPVGHATVFLLAMNAPAMVTIRTLLHKLGEWE